MAGRSRTAHVLELRDQAPPLLGRAPPGPAPGLHPAAVLHPHPPALIIDDPRRPLPFPLPLPHPHPIEDRFAAQYHEIQALLLDNQRLAATHVALKQELTAAQHDLRLAAAAASKARAERDAELRDVLDRAARAEAEARAVEGMRAELAQVRSDVQRLGAARDDLAERLQGLKAELARSRSELGQASAVHAEIEAMHHELQRGRSAVEYEKKVHADNLEQSQVMEKNMVTMAREVEKLRAEFANAEKRARAAAAAAAANPGPGYPGAYGNPEMGYEGGTYSEAYGMHQAQFGADGGSRYGAVAASHGQYDIQQAHAHR